jgi:hypothetical protein
MRELAVQAGSLLTAGIGANQVCPGVRWRMACWQVVSADGWLAVIVLCGFWQESFWAVQ